MNIVVCGKVIPASTVTIEIDPNTKRMIRKGVPHELDPAAASAVEEGLRLTEKHGGAVTLITMGTSDATIGIRNALAMGAASAVHIFDDAVSGSDTLGTSKLLAAAIKKQEFDLVICATESSDSYSGTGLRKSNRSANSVALGSANGGALSTGSRSAARPTIASGRVRHSSARAPLRRSAGCDAANHQ